ncbi:MAG: DUF6089 family protein [Flavobacteriales bacterium]|nr:DUF6089 family protein [Flavobacteriales bacterium]
MRLIVAFISCLFLLTAGIDLSAQGKKFETSREFGLVAGTSYYIGDINPYQHFNGTLRVGGGAMYRENLDKRWSIKGQVFYGTIEATDADSDDLWQQNRNLSFRNEIIEGSVTVELNYVDYQIGNRKDPISPYVFLGLGYYSHKPQANYLGRWYELQPLGTEGQGTSEGEALYSLNGVSIPFGVGLKANLFSIVAISLEWGMRKTYTDYLDDVSTTYANPAVLADESGELAVILSDRSLGLEGDLENNAGLQRGDPGRRDWFNFTTVTLSIRLGKPPTSCWNQ